MLLCCALLCRCVVQCSLDGAHDAPHTKQEQKKPPSSPVAHARLQLQQAHALEAAEQVDGEEFRAGGVVADGEQRLVFGLFLERGGEGEG